MCTLHHCVVPSSCVSQNPHPLLQLHKNQAEAQKVNAFEHINYIHIRNTHSLLLSSDLQRNYLQLHNFMHLEDPVSSIFG